MITVLGASGFVGSHLGAYLDRSPHDFQAVPRGADIPIGPLGHVIYCIGVTGDFPERPWEAVDAHVCSLLELVRQASFESLLYVSSVRLYAGGSGPAREEDELRLNPLRAGDLYNASKALGETITLSLGARGRVARPSNVYGRGQRNSFIAEIVDEAHAEGAVTFRSPPASSRDYVSVDDVARLLVEIALRGRERIYNVASGVGTTNAELGSIVSGATGCAIRYAPDAVPSPVPPIDTSRIREEFGFAPAALQDALSPLLERRA
ncbi:MAG TPA: NAD(P)-dependent oxidoreductase [Allosphingosinicella sp.]|nr:NAD(P)-dependent oxidoreductase [Allosphingosinicella sp.]